jgi:hypothetical protein
MREIERAILLAIFFAHENAEKNGIADRAHVAYPRLPVHRFAAMPCLLTIQIHPSIFDGAMEFAF